MRMAPSSDAMRALSHKWVGFQLTRDVHHINMEPVARLALELSPASSTARPVTWHIFVDGSGGNRLHPAIHAARSARTKARIHRAERQEGAWAVVILAERTDDRSSSHYTFEGTFQGTIAIDTKEQGWLGATRSTSYTSECTALCWGLMWAAQADLATGRHHAVIHYDSQSAIDAAQGHTNGEAEPQLTGVLRTIWHMAFTARRLHAEHHASHTGMPWNELVGAIAAACGSGQLPRNVPSVDDRAHLLIDHPHLASYGALQQLARRFPDAAPQLHDGVLYAGMPPPPSPSPIYLRDQMAERTDSGTIDKFTGNNVTVFSANVLTLKAQDDNKHNPDCSGTAVEGLCSPGKETLILRQARRHKAWLVGIQEARIKQGWKSSEGFLQYSSGNHKGKLGVTLWVSSTIPYACDTTADGHLRVKKDHIAIVTARTRVLAARIRAPLFDMRIVVSHAPTKSANEAERQKHWEHVRQAISMMGGVDVWLTDANAALGSVVSASISSWQGQAQCPNGDQLHSIALEQGMLVPATWQSLHKGDGTTWTSPDGSATSRGDYVLVKACGHHTVIASWVEEGMDFFNPIKDHRAAAARLHIGLREQGVGFGIPAISADREAMLSNQEQKQGFAQDVHEMQPPNWSTDVHQHCDTLDNEVVQRMQHRFPAKKKPPKPDYFSESTVQLIEQRETINKSARKLPRAIRHTRIGHAFAAWAGLTDFMAENTWRNMTEPEPEPDAHAGTLTRLDSNRHRAFAHKWAKAYHQEVLRLAYLEQLRTPLTKVIKHAIKEDKAQKVDNITTNVAAATDDASVVNSKELFRAANMLRLINGAQLKKSGSSPLPMLIADDGMPADTPQGLVTVRKVHHQANEMGRDATIDNIMQVTQAIQAEVAESLPICHEVPCDCVPTIFAVADELATTPKGRATSREGIPGELLSISAQQMATHLWLLMCKSIMWARTPLQWKGGPVFDLMKKPKFNFTMKSMRGIMLSSALGKRADSAIGDLIRPHCEAYYRDNQCGGRPNRGIDYCKHTVRMATSIAQQRNHSLSVLFTDVASAFYRVLRQLCLPTISTEEELAYIVRELKFPAEIMDDIRRALQQPNAAEQASIPEPLVRYLDDKHICTWFTPAGSNQVSITACGTLPGSPFANVVYDLLATRVLNECERELKRQGLVIQLPAPAKHQIKSIARPTQYEGTVDVTETSFVDDNAFFIFSEHADTHSNRTRAATETIDSIFAAHALSLGYGPTKTAAAIVLRGQGSAEARRNIMLRDKASVALNVRGQQQSLAIVPSYVHLGEGQSARPRIGPALSNKNS